MVRTTLVLTVLAGCTQRYVPPQSIAPEVTQLQVQHRSHGTSFRCARLGDVLWATDGRSIQVLNRRGAVLHVIELGELGDNAPIVDLAVGEDFAAVVLEHDQVQVLDIADPRHPLTIKRASSGRLGLEPRQVAIVNGAVVVFGDDGAVRLDDLEHLVRGESVTSVANGSDGGWYITGRRIKRLRDGGYVGTASLLAPSPSGACAFARNEGDAALLGVLGADAHEVDPARMTVAVGERVHRMRFDGDTLLVLTQSGLHAWRLQGGALQPLRHWPQRGLHDAVTMGDGHVLAVGEHGRSVVDLDRAQGNEVHRHETAGGLRSIGPGPGGLVAHGTAGAWHFEPGINVKRVRDSVPTAAPATSASILNWSITLDEAGRALVSTPLGEATLQAPGGGAFTCVTTTGDAFWLGHDRGIERISPPAGPIDPPTDATDVIDPMLGATRMSVRLGGPILGCTPLVLGRGVAYATKHDGFGMVVERR